MIPVLTGHRLAQRPTFSETWRRVVAHLLRHDLIRAEQYRRILAIPAKRAQSRPPAYLVFVRS